MSNNLDRYKSDLEQLIQEGSKIRHAFLRYAFSEEFEEEVLKNYGGDKEKTKKYLDTLPDFKISYQSWYSEALALVKQILPDRVQDFVRFYEKPKGRKDINYESYTIEDALQDIKVIEYGKIIANSKSALPNLEQQISIILSVKRRFESSLFEIKQLVQADLFDSELDAARELLKNKFYRAAGAVSGVVLEKHLHQVCENHNVNISKKNPSIADLNELLKTADVITVPQWRFNQHLADIRNLCDHNKKIEPTPEQVLDLIDGVAKVTKTIY